LQPSHVARVALTLAWLSASIGGCSTAPAKPPLMANLAKGEVTVRQLRAVDYEYASRFGQLVASTARDIAENTDDGEVREKAYRWRMWASPTARASAFDQDPFAGLLELWALAGQQRIYLTEGKGKDSFGDQQGKAVDTARALELNIKEQAARVMTEEEFQRVSPRVDEWVAAHPIEEPLFVRPSARADLAALVPDETHGGLKAVGSIEDTFRDLNDRITILTVQVPNEVRWQAEYLTNSLFEERFQEPADSVVDAVEEVTAFLDDFERVLSTQTATLLTGIEQERVAIFDTIGEQSGEILDAVEAERAEILATLDTRIASATTELDKVGRGLIDHFFIRLIEVLAVVGIGVFLLVVLVLVVVRRGSRSND
jgi:hypothetical protein